MQKCRSGAGPAGGAAGPVSAAKPASICVQCLCQHHCCCCCCCIHGWHFWRPRLPPNNWAEILNFCETSSQAKNAFHQQSMRHTKPAMARQPGPFKHEISAKLARLSHCGGAAAESSRSRLEGTFFQELCDTISGGRWRAGDLHAGSSLRRILVTNRETAFCRLWFATQNQNQNQNQSQWQSRAQNRAGISTKRVRKHALSA